MVAYCLIFWEHMKIEANENLRIHNALVVDAINEAV